MSFKRVGDDYDAIKVQKKLRVSELLLEDIPEDEAAFAKNGRLVCLVCGRRPVFDTVAMLSIHRQGKKHLAAAGIKLEKQREIAELKQKREHDKYLKEFSSSVDFREEKSPLLQKTQKDKELIMNMNPQTSQLGNHHLQHVLSSSSSSSVSQKNIPFFQSRVVTLHSPLQSERSKQSIKTEPTNNQVTAKVESNSSTKQVKKETFNKGVDKERQSISAKCSTSTELHDTKRKMSEYYAKLLSSGWIMGTDGKWKKDETVEFDSDEEEPPLPPDF